MVWDKGEPRHGVPLLSNPIEVHLQFIKTHKWWFITDIENIRLINRVNTYIACSLCQAILSKCIINSVEYYNHHHHHLLYRWRNWGREKLLNHKVRIWAQAADHRISALNYQTTTLLSVRKVRFDLIIYGIPIPDFYGSPYKGSETVKKSKTLFILNFKLFWAGLAETERVNNRMNIVSFRRKFWLLMTQSGLITIDSMESHQDSLMWFPMSKYNSDKCHQSCHQRSH